MENKLNHKAIEEYAQAYSKKLMASFFAQHDRIDGNQILSLSSIKQVNLFVLKSLYEQWQRESVKLRSPYFDYENEKVKEAMKVFLNSLSRHISIARKDFEPLLHRAVVDTFVLTLAPIAFFSKEVERNADPLVSVLKLKEINKYVQINKVLIQSVISEMEALRLPEAFAGEVVRLFYNAHHDNRYKVTEWFEIIDQFGSVLPAQISEFIIEEPEAKIKTDFGRLGLKGVTNVQPVAVAKSGLTPVPATRTIEPSVSYFEEESVQSPIKAEEKPIEVKAEPVPVAKVEEPVKQETVPQQHVEEKLPLHQKFSKEHLTLNDKLAQGTKATIIDKHQKGKIESIRSAIPLNEKFILINELFNGDNIGRSVALQELDNSANEDSAMDLITQKYAKQYNWNIEDESVQSLISLVERKFS